MLLKTGPQPEKVVPEWNQLFAGLEPNQVKHGFIAIPTLYITQYTVNQKTHSYETLMLNIKNQHETTYSETFN